MTWTAHPSYWLPIPALPLSSSSASASFHAPQQLSALVISRPSTRSLEHPSNQAQEATGKPENHDALPPSASTSPAFVAVSLVPVQCHSNSPFPAQPAGLANQVLPILRTYPSAALPSCPSLLRRSSSLLRILTRSLPWPVPLSPLSSLLSLSLSTPVPPQPFRSLALPLPISHPKPDPSLKIRNRQKLGFWCKQNTHNTHYLLTTLESALRRPQ